MACVDDDRAAPPPDLQLAWLVGQHHLPESGGVLDQDYTQLSRMRSLANVYRTVSKLRSLTGERVNTDLTVDERKLLGRLREMGIRLGGLRG